MTFLKIADMKCRCDVPKLTKDDSRRTFAHMIQPVREDVL